MAQTKKLLENFYTDELENQYKDDEYQYWYYVSKKMELDEIISNTFS